MRHPSGPRFNSVRVHVLTKYTCGHIGRENISARAKVKAFIKVAEIRNAKVEESTKSCPDC